MFVASVAAAAACGADRPASDETTAALSVCDEIVPPDRFVDGIPAYSQCAGFETAPIYSNNGVDTSTTALGADWIRTQGSGGYQCTELAHRYLHFRWNVTSWLPNGNAGVWCETPPPRASGVVQTMTPVHGDLIVFAPGVCGASPGTGHVAVVDTVDDAAAELTIVEQNRAGRRSAAQSCATCFLHVVANGGASGSGADGGAGSDDAGGADAGSMVVRTAGATRAPAGSTSGPSGAAIACGIGTGGARAGRGAGLALATVILALGRRRVRSK